MEKRGQERTSRGMVGRREKVSASEVRGGERSERIEKERTVAGKVKGRRGKGR